MNIPSHPLLTILEFCDIARIGNTTAYRLIGDGKVDTLKIRDKILSSITGIFGCKPNFCFGFRAENGLERFNSGIHGGSHLLEALQHRFMFWLHDGRSCKMR